MPTYCKADGVLAEELDGQAAIVDPQGAELITLNPVGSLVWSLLDGQREVDHIVTTVVEECGPVDRATVALDVRTFLSELVSLGLIVEASP